MGASQLGIQLSADDVNKIVSFLDGLMGEQPKVTHPELPPSVGSKLYAALTGFAASVILLGIIYGLRHYAVTGHP